MNILRKHIKKILREEISTKPDNIKDFQRWVLNIKGDNKILGSYGADGMWGKYTSMAWEKYKNDYLKSTPKEKTLNTKKISTGKTVILLGGLDTRKGDLSISKQVELVKSGLSNKNVVGFRYNQPEMAINEIKNTLNPIVILFSAGCAYADKIAEVMENKKDLYIVEPYAVSQATSNSVNRAVSSGVPNSNVITGPISARGNGVVSGSSKTPSGTDHWGALKFVTTLI